MNPLFEKSVYQNRREKLTQLVGHGIAVFLGNHEAPMNYPDNTYNFRQDSDFLYFFGLSAADLAAVIDFDAHQSIIFGNDFTIDDIIWMGDQPTIASLASQVGVTETRPLAKLEPMFREAHQKGRKVHFIPQYRGDNQIWLSNMTCINVNNIREAASVELIKGIVELRSAKEACEIEEM
ncbi:MAG: aminopeptidase P N-terminal domain-containing protein, partial [Bacteroidales bacterium]|nr:aminopeptidase P N-terminal domain-containing protein [Bacteroidales bacterium]